MANWAAHSNGVLRQSLKTEIDNYTKTQTIECGRWKTDDRR